MHLSFDPTISLVGIYHSGTLEYIQNNKCTGTHLKHKQLETTQYPSLGDW